MSYTRYWLRDDLSLNVRSCTLVARYCMEAVWVGDTKAPNKKQSSNMTDAPAKTYPSFRLDMFSIIEPAIFTFLKFDWCFYFSRFFLGFVCLFSFTSSKNYLEHRGVLAVKCLISSWKLPRPALVLEITKSLDYNREIFAEFAANSAKIFKI